MTGFNTYFRSFPSLATQYGNGLEARKSVTADGTARAWTLIGDDKTFYLIMNTGDTCLYHMIAFGYFFPFRTNELFNTFVDADVGTFNTGTAGNALGTSWSNVSSLYLPRNWAGLATNPVAVQPMTLPYVNVLNAVFGATVGMYTPNMPDTGYYVMPVYIYETGPFRGRFPGLYHPMQSNPLVNYETMTNVAGLPGITLTAVTIAFNGATTGTMLFDTFGPWN